MSKPVQISAPVSQETKDLLDEHVRATGVKKGYLIESALRFHLRALHDLPADVLVPPRLVLTRPSAERVVERLRSPGEPTDELRRLMSEDDED